MSIRPSLLASLVALMVLDPGASPHTRARGGTLVWPRHAVATTTTSRRRCARAREREGSVAVSDAITKAARQSVRYHNWSRAIVRASQIALATHGRRRAGELYRKTCPQPEEPAPPEGTKRNSAAHTEWRKRDPGYLAYVKAHARWTKGMRRAERDRRGSGYTERRSRPFPESTGEAVLDRVAGDDEFQWARLASRALNISRDPSFRSSCGRPKTVSEKNGTKAAA